MKSKKKIITLIVVAALVLSIGTVGVYAAVNASRINPDNLIESESGIRIYVNLDENGVPIDLTDEELQELSELMAFRDENGNIIPPSDELVGEKDGVIEIHVVNSPLN